MPNKPDEKPAINFNVLKKHLHLKQKGYKPLNKKEDLDKIPIRMEMKARIMDLQQRLNPPIPVMVKKAKVIGGIQPPTDFTNLEIPAETVLPEYENYITQKAHEPKSKWLTTSIYPAILGTAMAKLVSSKVLKTPTELAWPVSAGIGGAIGATGAIMKIMDDSKIRSARELVKQKDFSDKVLFALKTKRVDDLSKPSISKFLENPNKNTIKDLPQTKELMGLVGLPKT